ncbi:hypothetical protein LTR09_005262 [Extremus antarcticus]|uniref:Uncharacterized protein n=1 Tax=Extremus antarcticus TaxID=702011 RepID=A0AAJ0GDP6_9PEZI|nr:hypothetical protein LTR09_005262 [Extremus antarcticus]
MASALIQTSTQLASTAIIEVDETPTCHLAALPKELRLEVHEHALTEPEKIRIYYRCRMNGSPYIAFANRSNRCGLVLTSHEIRDEAIKVFLSTNTFLSTDANVTNFSLRNLAASSRRKVRGPSYACGEARTIN